MLPKAVIFDLDGLLVESEPYWHQGFRSAISFLAQQADTQSPELSTETLYKFEGGRVPDTIRSLANATLPTVTFTDEMFAQATDHAVATTSQLMADDPTPIAQNVAVAKDLARRGYRLAVASSSPLLFVEASLKAVNVRDNFDIIESGFNLEFSKPHPEVYVNALRALAVSSDEAIALEDSTTGAEAAVRAGIPTILVNAHGRISSQSVKDLREFDTPLSLVTELETDNILNFFVRTSQTECQS